jgi:hypothetical protein
MPRAKRSKKNPIDSDIAPTRVPTPPGPARYGSGYEAEMRATLIALGANNPDALVIASGDFWQRCKAAGVDAKTCAATIYGSERHRHEVARTVINEEAPTRDEWEVIVRRHGASIDKITHASGRKPDEIRGNDVIFGDFFDDEKAGSFARKMTRAGFVAYYGPRAKMAAGPIAAEPAAGEAAPVIGEAAPVIAEGHIPFRKVARDPAQHEADVKLAETYGPIKNPEKVYEVVGPMLQTEDQEVFLVLPLNLRGELKCAPYEVARGQRSRVSVGVEDVMRAVIDSGCEGFIVVHNHPSSKVKPSQADRQLTDQIKAAAKPFGSGVKFLDHVVIGSRQCFSIVEDRIYPARGRFKA